MNTNTNHTPKVQKRQGGADAVKNMALTAVLIALIALLGFTPVGMIPLGFINISILAIPVIVGTISVGPKCGLVLGACFGGISALSAFGIYGTPSALASALVAASPALALVVCFVPRLLVPVAAHGVYRLASKRKTADAKRATPVRGAVGTLIYLALITFLLIRLDAYRLWYVDAAALLSAAGVFLLLYKKREAVALSAIAGAFTNTVFYLGLMLLSYIAMGIDSANLLAVIGGTGLIAGSAEAVAAAFVCTGVCMALSKVKKAKL